MEKNKLNNENNFISLQGCYTPQKSSNGQTLNKWKRLNTLKRGGVDDIRIYSERAGRAFVGISLSGCPESNSSCALKAAAYSGNVRMRVLKRGDLFSTNIHNLFEMKFPISCILPFPPQFTASLPGEKQCWLTWHIMTSMHILIFQSSLFRFKLLSKVYFRVAWHCMRIVTGHRWDYERTHKMRPFENVALTGGHWTSANRGNKLPTGFVSGLQLLLLHSWLAVSWYIAYRTISGRTEPAQLVPTPDQSHLIHIILFSRFCKLSRFPIDDGSELSGHKWWLQTEPRAPLCRRLPHGVLSGDGVGSAVKRRLLPTLVSATQRGRNTWSAGSLHFVLACSHFGHRSGLL